MDICARIERPTILELVGEGVGGHCKRRCLFLFRSLFNWLFGRLFGLCDDLFLDLFYYPFEASVRFELLLN